MKFSEPHAENRPPWHARELMDFTPYLDGLRYMRRDRRLMATMLVKAAFGALGIHWVVVPLFGEKVFPLFRPGYTAEQAGLLAMSVLMCARGLGAMAGPAIAGAWAGSDPVKLRATIGLGFALMGVGYLGLAVAPSLLLACLGLVVMAAGASSAWTFSTTLLQLQTEDRFRGRVFSADFSLLLFNMAAMSYVAGVLVDRGWSVRVLSLLAGFGASVPTLLWWRAQRLWRESADAGESL